MFKKIKISKKLLNLSICCALISAIVLSVADFDAKCEDLRKNVLRLHIIANSDNKSDQSVKLKVRDAIIEVFGQLMADAGKNSCEEAYAFLQQHTQKMQAIAQECCAQNGFDGSVTAETGMLSLPSKQYGHVLLPEGEYRALRITLGEGKGQNWWCVLYPQLCLALSSADSANASLFWQSKQIFAHWLLIEQ